MFAPDFRQIEQGSNREENQPKLRKGNFEVHRGGGAEGDLGVGGEEEAGGEEEKEKFASRCCNFYNVFEGMGGGF